MRLARGFVELVLHDPEGDTSSSVFHYASAAGRAVEFGKFAQVHMDMSLANSITQISARLDKGY
jgi:hypothetical protein